MLLHYTYQIFLPALCIQKYLVWISCGTDSLFCPDACFSSLVCQDLPCIAILELLFQAAFFQQKLCQPFDRQPLHLLLISQIINPGYKITDRRLRDILDRLNEKYKDHIVSKFLITLGDEFQGLLCGGEHILDMVNEIRMEMYPVRLRFGIGFGQITTDIKSEMALGADGPGYYRAREAVELLKEREKKNRPVLAELCLRLDEKDQEKEVLLNTVFDLMYVVESGWTERQRETIWDMLLYGDGQQNTARRLSISQPTVQKALAAGSYYTYENALKNASKILGDIQND